MSKIKIMTDSSVQLSPEEIEKYGITVVPLSVTIDGHTYTDGVDITRADFIQKMDEAEKLPKTSQPPVGLFVERMEELTAVKSWGFSWPRPCRGRLIPPARPLKW